MMSNSFYKVVGLVLLASIFVVISSQNVSAVQIPAITSNGPNQNDFVPNPRDGIGYEVSHGGPGNTLHVLTSTVKVYFTSSRGTIRIENPNTCVWPGNTSNRYSDFNTSPFDWDTRFTFGTFSAGSKSQIGGYEQNEVHRTGGGTKTLTQCNQSYQRTISGLRRTTGEGRDNLYEAYVTSTMRSFGSPATSPYSALNSFKIVAVPEPGEQGFVGYAQDSGGFTMQFRDMNNINTFSYRDFAVPFAPDCSISGPTTKVIEWFDDDYRQEAQGWGGSNGAASPQDIKMSIYEADAGSTNFTKIPITYRDPVTGSTVTGINITPKGGQGTDQDARITVEPGKRYIWEFRDVYDRNGVQFYVPYDAIYFTNPCPGAELENIVSINKPVIITGESAQINFAIRNNSRFYDEQTNYRKFVFADIDGNGAYNSGDRIISGSEDTGSTLINRNTTRTLPTFNETSATFAKYGPFGKICGYLNTTPTRGTVTNDNPFVTCSVIGKIPKIHINNGDITSGGGLPTANCQFNSSQSQLTGYDDDSGQTRAEYGVFAMGGVQGFGSYGLGSRSASGNNLTFANTPTNGFYKGTGTVTHCLNDPFKYFTNGRKTPSNPDFRARGSTAFETRRNITVPQGQRDVYYTDRDIYIDHNIEFNAANSVERIPQFALLTTGTIYVTSDVTRLDGVYGAGKGMYTCYGGATTRLSLSDCDKQLTINGAIYTAPGSGLITWRTFGSGESNSSEPAEEINLSPAVILSEFEDSKDNDLETTKIEELPPRF